MLILGQKSYIVGPTIFKIPQPQLTLLRIALGKSFFLWKAMEMRLHDTCNFIVKKLLLLLFPPFLALLAFER